MARTLLQQKQTAVNAMKDKLMKIDATKNPSAVLRAAATLRRLEKAISKPTSKPDSLPKRRWWGNEHYQSPCQSQTSK